MEMKGIFWAFETKTLPPLCEGQRANFFRVPSSSTEHANKISFPLLLELTSMVGLSNKRDN